MISINAFITLAELCSELEHTFSVNTFFCSILHYLFTENFSDWEGC